MKEKKRVGSFTLTEEGYQALATLQKKSGRSKKDLVSEALVGSMNRTIDQKVVEFQLPNPKELMGFRSDIVALESEAQAIVDGLYSLRPRDKEYAKKVAAVIGQLQEHIVGLRFIDGEFRKKLRVLKGLTAEDHEQLPRILRWMDDFRLKAKGLPDMKRRLEFAGVVENLAILAASPPRPNPSGGPKDPTASTS